MSKRQHVIERGGGEGEGGFGQICNQKHRSNLWSDAMGSTGMEGWGVGWRWGAHTCRDLHSKSQTLNPKRKTTLCPAFALHRSS